MCFSLSFGSSADTMTCYLMSGRDSRAPQQILFLSTNIVCDESPDRIKAELMRS
jgi:hypothetical protein